MDFFSAIALGPYCVSRFAASAWLRPSAGDFRPTLFDRVFRIANSSVVKSACTLTMKSLGRGAVPEHSIVNIAIPGRIAFRHG